MLVIPSRVAITLDILLGLKKEDFLGLFTKGLHLAIRLFAKGVHIKALSFNKKNISCFIHIMFLDRFNLSSL
jgi:hypothetical protein